MAVFGVALFAIVFIGLLRSSGSILKLAAKLIGGTVLFTVTVGKLIIDKFRE